MKVRLQLSVLFSYFYFFIFPCVYMWGRQGLQPHWLRSSLVEGLSWLLTQKAYYAAARWTEASPPWSVMSLKVPPQWHKLWADCQLAFKKKKNLNYKEWNARVDFKFLHKSTADLAKNVWMRVIYIIMSLVKSGIAGWVGDSAALKQLIFILFKRRSEGVSCLAPLPGAWASEKPRGNTTIKQIFSNCNYSVLSPKHFTIFWVKHVYI